MRVAFVGFGEVGAAFAKAFAAAGAEVTAYDRVLDTADGRARLEARADGIAVAFGALDEALRGARYVFSTVTTDVAREAAIACRAHLAPGQSWIDLNATEPAVKREIAAIVEPSGAAFVEGALLGAVGVSGARTELLLGGPAGAATARALAAEFGLNVRHYSDEIGKASTYKMLRSVFSKGLEALLIEFLVAGERAGMRSELWAEVVELLGRERFEKVAANWVCSHAVAHERRWHEMVQVEKVLREMGIEPLMTAATESLFRRSVALDMGAAFPARPPSMEPVIRFLERRLDATQPAQR
ncbi:MAG: NAD(P)-binding domain-containing protein [Betaproteobacteria bacterium]|jgi:3-hydroxyisobutyrate dehydrogenase-like beta-hydroxyacid dehydrogenase|nr:NAD(P)-binding domain-containing protein [Betaproteobacteria bacterium]